MVRRYLASFLSLCLVWSFSADASPRRSKDFCQQFLRESVVYETLPEIKPVIAKIRDKPFDDPDYQFEMKYDGYRGIAYFDRDRDCRIISRSGKPLTHFEKLCAAVGAQLKVQNAIFDGEVIAYDPSRRPVFNRLQRRQEPFQYVAFDLLWVNGHDLRSLPLVDRRRVLHEVVPKTSSVITESLAVVGNGTRLFQLMVEYDLEGIVAKPLDSKYSRSTKWYKIKNPSYSQAAGRGRFFSR